MAALPQSSRPPSGSDPNPRWPVASPDKPLPTVQLRHELPDGSAHVDWLIARDGGGAQPLLSMRLPGSLSELPPGGSMLAQPLADHRPDYLDYEGPISGGRGSVTRLARGQVWRTEVAQATWRVTIDWSQPGEQADGELVQIIEVTPLADTRWRVDLIGLEMSPCSKATDMPPQDRDDGYPVGMPRT